MRAILTQFVAVFLSMQMAFGAVCTSTGAGTLDFNSIGSWDCGHVPVYPDSAVVNHDMFTSAATAFGPDGATGVAALTVNTGKTFTNNFPMNLRGDLIGHRGTTVENKSTVTLDPGPGITYEWTTGTTGTGNARLLMTGTSAASPAVLQVGARGGIGRFVPGMTTGRIYGDVELNYAELIGLGTSSVIGIDSYHAQVGTGSRMRHVLVKNCGAFFTRFSNANQFLDWDDVTIIESISATNSVSFQITADKTTYDRTITNLNVWQTTPKVVNFAAVRDFTVSDWRLYNSNVVGVGATHAIRNTYTRIFNAMDAGTPLAMTMQPNGGNSITNSIAYSHRNNPKGFGDGSTLGASAGANTVSDNVADGDDYTNPSDTGDWSGFHGTATLTRNIVAHKAGNLFTVSNANGRVTVDNNTTYRVAPVNAGEAGGGALWLSYFRNNLMVDMLDTGDSEQNHARMFWQIDDWVPQSSAVFGTNVWYQPADNDMETTNIPHPNPAYGLSYMGAQTYTTWFATGSYGDTDKGATDFPADPRFADPDRSVRSWVGARLGVDTSAWTFDDVVEEVFKASGRDRTGAVVTPTTLNVTDALAYIRQGFMPQNPKVWQAGYNGSTVGAVSAHSLRGSITAAAIF